MDAREQAQPIPEAIASYRILGLLGEGGMGTVYLAEQSRPVRREVALKVIKLGMDSAQVLQRFELERQALALMEHPNIANVFDAGTTELGQPYFAMEYVRGEPILEYADSHALSVNERLRLFQQVCNGVQHAHLKGVVHRDLTPRNVLVTEQDGEARAKIIDFGLARATDQDLTDGTAVTRQGEIFGTPFYMSPEQIGIDGLDVDTRSDIYTLGVLLFELLTGDLPYGRPVQSPAAILELRRKLEHEDPSRPSTALTRAATAVGFTPPRGEELRTLTRRLRGELDWIVMKALERDRDRRYQTAQAFAQDIQRHLDDEPVLAGPPSAAYKLRKFVSRYRLQVVAGLLLMLSLVAGVVGTTWFLFEARVQARIAKDNEQRALQAADEAERERQRADQEAREARGAREVADQRARAEQEARRLAQSALAKFELLANVVLLREAESTAEQLFPPWPERVDDLRDWLRREGVPLEAVLPEVQQSLAELRERAISDSAPEYRFAQANDQFLHDTTARLVADLQAFVDPEAGALEAVRARLAWAESIEEASIGRHRAAWDAVRARIAAADSVYAGFDVPPQLGLVPLGANPITGLEEFVHLASADPAAAVPAIDDDGLVQIGAEAGIVFVLLPAGSIEIVGDPAAGTASAGERRTVAIEPVFVARHELTQAQWQRLSRGERPSFYFAGRELAAVKTEITACHPVEQVSWQSCIELLTHYGLDLPTEAQWEYACRAGTTTPWASGATADTLSGFGNVADLTASRVVPQWSSDQSVDDGHVIHAPVGSYAFNRFGLHDAHGNVWEWCRDAFGDGGARVMRGGSHTNAPDFARSGHRGSAPIDTRSNNLGVRAVRRVYGR